MPKSLNESYADLSHLFLNRWNGWARSENLVYVECVRSAVHVFVRISFIPGELFFLQPPSDMNELAAATRSFWGPSPLLLSTHKGTQGLL